MFSRKGFRFSSAIGAILIGWATVALACQVPVFRYALERWEADRYTVVVQTGKSGELSKAETEVVDFFREMESSDEFPANIFLKTDLTANENSDTATLSLIYPQKIRGFEQSPIWTGPATMENAKKIVDSPIRRQIVTELLKGKSAVWVVLESGDSKLDDDAAKNVIDAVKKGSEVLKIPEGVLTKEDLLKDQPPTAAPIDPENILQSEVPLKIDFSVIRMSRDDPAEAVFLQMLVNIESDLREFAKEPMVYPIFGRGRILEPLIGRGINENNTLDYAGYLCGACSCEVKDQNPGMDLLVAANWSAAIEGSEVIIEKILPPLVGTAALTAPEAVGDVDNAVVNDLEPPIGDPDFEIEVDGKKESPWSRLVYVVGGIVGVIAVASILISRKKES